MTASSTVWKYGDDVSTDNIYPGRYIYELIADEDMGRYALADLDPDFAAKMQPGDVIVAGKNWGCGSSREQAVKCLKAKGVGAVIAKSIARIYYRNALNQGLPVIVCPEAVEALKQGDAVTVDFVNNRIITGSGEFTFPPYPEFVKGIIADGGLLDHVIKTLREQGRV